MNTETKNISFKPRELKVIQLLAEGYSSREIAEKLKFSFYTIKQDIHNIIYKSNAKNRINAIYKLVYNGYVKPPTT